jgi:hypothetical protein
MNPTFWLSTIALLLGVASSARTDENRLAISNTPKSNLARQPYREVEINPELVCKVQHAIRWKDEPWTEKQCLARSMDFGEAADTWNLSPATLLALGVNEADLRTSECHRVGRGLDCGILGVRCVLGSSGKCVNRPVRGLTPATLLKPSVNIQKGAEILATLHGGNLAGYNGGPHSRDDGAYPRKIGAILSALGGVDVLAKYRRHKKETRMEKLTRTISQAVQ